MAISEGDSGQKYVSDNTEALYALLIASGAQPETLTALVSSAYADGAHHVLDEFEGRLEQRNQAE